MRKWRKDNPVSSAYATLRDHAKERGILLLLTIEEFSQVIEGTDYIARSGRGRHELQLDRIDATKPYTLENLCVVTCSENAAKSNHERKTLDHRQHMIARRTAKALEECIPF